ncbi:unnamed protein product, partial [Rotaria sordida]
MGMCNHHQPHVYYNEVVMPQHQQQE